MFLQGLTEEQADFRLQEDGPNALVPPKEIPNWLKFIRQLFLGFNALLWISAALSFMTYGIQFTQNSNPPGDNVGYTDANSCNNMWI